MNNNRAHDNNMSKRASESDAISLHLRIDEQRERKHEHEHGRPLHDMSAKVRNDTRKGYMSMSSKIDMNSATNIEANLNMNMSNYNRNRATT